MASAQLLGTILKRAYIYPIDAGSADFVGADLRGAHVGGDCLKGATLRLCDLRDIKLVPLSYEDTVECYESVRKYVPEGNGRDRVLNRLDDARDRTEFGEPCMLTCDAYNLCTGSASSDGCQESDTCGMVPPAGEFKGLRCANAGVAKMLARRAIAMKEREPIRSIQLALALLAQARAAGYEGCRGVAQIPEGLLHKLGRIAKPSP